MPSTTFIPGTVITSSWLNDINTSVYKTGLVNIKLSDYGAIGDGASHPLSSYFGSLAEAQVKFPHALSLTDELDGIAIQAALNLGAHVYLPAGRYLTSYELVPTDGSYLQGDGAFFWQFAANHPAVGKCTEIRYVGAAVDNRAVYRMSKVATGTLPVYTVGETQSLRGVGISDIVLNGNNLVGFGLYVARQVVVGTYNNITVCGTKKRGFFFGEHFTATASNLAAIFNYGSGFSIGEDYFGWATNNIVNATQWNTLLAFKNGLAKLYNDVSNPKDGVGFVIEANRTNTFTNIIAELNYGAGVYLSPRTGPNIIDGLYLEDNCHYDPVLDIASSTASAYVDGDTTEAWGLFGFNRKITGDTIQMLIRSVFGAAVSTAPVRYQHIKFTGDTSGGFVEEPLEPWVINGMFGVRSIDSAFHNYSVENVQTGLLDGIGSVDNNLIRCLPYSGLPESVGGPLTTLYVGNTQTGDRSGRDTSNYMLFQDAIECARVCRRVDTINIAAMTSASTPAFAQDCMGHGFTRRLIIDGGTTGHLADSSFDNVGIYIQDWSVLLSIKNMAVISRASISDSKVEFSNCVLIRTGSNSSALAAIIADQSSVEINGTTVINVSASSAAVKIPLAVQGNSTVSLNNAAAGTLLNFTAGNAIHFNEGSGIVRVSLTTATALWGGAANIVRNTGGSAGMVLAPNGLNP